MACSYMATSPSWFTYFGLILISEETRLGRKKRSMPFYPFCFLDKGCHYRKQMLTVSLR